MYNKYQEGRKPFPGPGFQGPGPGFQGPGPGFQSPGPGFRARDSKNCVFMHFADLMEKKN